MLSRVAEIDWVACGCGLFVTLTFPDDLLPNTYAERNKYRYLFNRYVEKLTGKQTGSVWRVEWVKRKSGRWLGTAMPHLHILYFGQVSVSEKTLRKHWARILSYKGHVQVKSKRVEVGKMAGLYVSKYCAKEEVSSLLDKVPYLNKTGRHCGWLRRHLIPVHPLRTVVKLNRAIVDWLRGRACETLWYYDARFDEGFTILGETALEIIREFGQRTLANRSEL